MKSDRLLPEDTGADVTLRRWSADAVAEPADARGQSRWAVRLRVIRLGTALTVVAVIATGCAHLTGPARHGGTSSQSPQAPIPSVIPRAPTPKPVASTRPTTIDLVPGTRIGKAELGDTLEQATAALGTGKREGRNIRLYRQDGVRTQVTFVAGHVFDIQTDSAPLLLDGTPLSKGYPYFRDHTRWSHATCQGTVNELFHFTKRTSAETTISWGPDGRLTNVLIQTVSTPLGSGCGAASDAQPAVLVGPAREVGILRVADAGAR